MTRSAPEHFDAISGRYAASEVHVDSPTIRRLHELLGPEPLGSICDVACGPGHLALSFAGKASRIVGVDAAPNMLGQFERLAGERGLAVEAVRAYAEQMPLASDSFDVVMSRLAPHHFADPTRAVREMTRLAKPDGRVAVIDLEGNEDPCLDDLNHELEVLHDPSHVRSYTAARWRYRDGARSAIRRRRRGKKSNRGWPGFPESSRWDWASVPARGNSTFPFVRL